ncbi:MAG TPA: hypothetical protein PKK06_18530 [Phycisphaerae bacterium]|nr:hypothetical protein [Phycisphaerae bacterium]HNU53390.1 hypothetical protein [Verrucomicrobiota bacterium]
MKSAIVKTIERIEHEFHQRAFGEELARVNALPLGRRRDYAGRLQQRVHASRRRSSSASRSRARKEVAV